MSSCEDVIPALVLVENRAGTIKSYYGDLIPETDPGAGR